MAADVGSLVRLMTGGGDAKEPASSGKSTAPITMDLLPGCCTLDSRELDLDLHVPCGWEKRLDLKSGKIYLQKCNSSIPSPSTSDIQPNKPLEMNKTKFQDLNYPPDSNKLSTPIPSDDASLDLRLLISSPSMSARSGGHQSVCTLDKVKWALERAEKDPNVVRKRLMSTVSKSSSSFSNSSSSIKLESDRLGDDREEKSIMGSFAAGCPSCLMYILILTSKPKCPRCNCDVPLPATAKKPKINLNMSI